MTWLTIALISFIGGGVATGGTILAINKSKEEKQDIEAIVSALETEFEKAQASVATSLTETDLLKTPCSSEYIEKNGDLLCREMFCRMNRQGGGAGSNGGAGATSQECSDISKSSLNLMKMEYCLPYSDTTTASVTGLNLNSKFAICMQQFEK